MDDDPSSPFIAGALAMCINVVAGVPLLVWCLFILRTDWNSVYIVKRNRFYVVSILICACIILFIRVPFLFVRLLIDNDLMQKLNLYLYFFLLFPSNLICGWAFFLRTWLFYFNSKLSDYESNKEWRMAIDPVHESTNWFVRNLRRWGNETFLSKLMLCCVGAKTACLVVIYYTSGSYGSFLANMWFYVIVFVMLIGYLYLWYKIARETSFDRLGILKEMITDVALVSVMGIAGLVILAMFATSTKWFYVCLMYLSLGVALALCYLLLPYAKLLFKRFYHAPRVRGPGSVLSTKSSKTGTHVRYDYTWDKIITVYDGYVAFLNHLSKEFSTENALYMQEYTQLKQVLCDYFGSIMQHIKDDSTAVHFNLILPPTEDHDVIGHANSNIGDGAKHIPESIISQNLRHDLHQLVHELLGQDRLNINNIVYAIDVKGGTDTNIKIQFCYLVIDAFRNLYSKYIDASRAPFMVNIASHNRHKLMQLFDSHYYKHTHRLLRKQTSMRLGRLFGNGSTEPKVGRKPSPQHEPIPAAPDSPHSAHSAQSAGRTNSKKNLNELKYSGINGMLVENVNKYKSLDELLTWLLQTIIETYEPSVVEVSRLMNDSFSRFRSQQRDLYKSLCQMVSQAG